MGSGVKLPEDLLTTPFYSEENALFEDRDWPLKDKELYKMKEEQLRWGSGKVKRIPTMTYWIVVNTHENTLKYGNLI